MTLLLLVRDWLTCSIKWKHKFAYTQRTRIAREICIYVCECVSVFIRSCDVSSKTINDKSNRVRATHFLCPSSCFFFYVYVNVLDFPLFSICICNHKWFSVQQYESIDWNGACVHLYDIHTHTEHEKGDKWMNWIRACCACVGSLLLFRIVNFIFYSFHYQFKSVVVVNFKEMIARIRTQSKSPTATALNFMLIYGTVSTFCFIIDCISSKI